MGTYKVALKNPRLNQLASRTWKILLWYGKMENKDNFLKKKYRTCLIRIGIPSNIQIPSLRDCINPEITSMKITNVALSIYFLEDRYVEILT